jgi:hypothetical protein
MFPKTGQDRRAEIKIVRCWIAELIRSPAGRSSLHEFRNPSKRMITDLEQHLSKTPRQTFWAVAFISGLIAVGLLVSTWNIQFWPTDAEVYYLPAARELPSLKYLSQINQSLDEERIKWLHGKEIHILAISVFQRLLHDTETLRPFMLVGTVSIFFSSILLFVIARRMWGEWTGLLVWFLFATSFWPYLYVLFAKHQTQGLAFFLLSVFLLVRRSHVLFALAAGAAFAASLYSSTVSALYFPYVLAAFCYGRKHLDAFFRDGIFCALGFAAVLLWVNYPNIAYNLKSYADYVRISGAFNHFYYNQSILVQWIPSFDLKDTRGGWAWIVRYFFLIMPVVFPLYLLSAGYLVQQFLKEKRWIFLGAIALSFSSPVLAEIKGVAQYGANYFTVFAGILFLIGYALFLLLKKEGKRAFMKNGLIAVLFLQVAVNGWIFVTDIYPSRMVTTLLSRKIEDLNVRRLATFPDHPLRRNLIDHLTPNVLNNIQWTPVKSIMDINEGYIVVPPVSTDAIYLASTSDYTDFDEDPFLNELVRQGRLKDYAVASLPTLSSSIYWAQEEEILAYRSLVLHQFPKNKDKTKVWILDAAALARDKDRLTPSPDEAFLYVNHIENIGSATQVRMFKGQRLDNASPVTLKGIATRIYKVGDPKDSLRAFIFKEEETQPMWVPVNHDFASHPVAAKDIAGDPQGGLVEFAFDHPITLDPGLHLIVIYRSGRASDRDFYRIYKDYVGRLQ